MAVISLDCREESSLYKTVLCKPKCKRAKPNTLVRKCKSKYQETQHPLRKERQDNHAKEEEEETLGNEEVKEHGKEGNDHCTQFSNLTLKSTIHMTSVILGKYEMKTWYASNYPHEMIKKNKLCICEHCFGYMTSRNDLLHHACTFSKSPPGKRIYFEKSGNVQNLQVFCIEGKEEATFCQNLCLFAKCFMEQKTLYFDVEPFSFYVLYRKDREGYHPVGYFSKEKNRVEFNLSCIVVFPAYQKEGYGSLMISLSYAIAMAESQCGGPETPLSALGKSSYLKYWKRTVLETLHEAGEDMSVIEISQKTGMTPEDIVTTFTELGWMEKRRGNAIPMTQNGIHDLLTNGKAIRTCIVKNLR